MKDCKGERQVINEDRTIKITPDFSVETIQDKKPRADILQTWRDLWYQPRLIYPRKQSIMIDRERKAFYDNF